MSKIRCWSVSFIFFFFQAEDGIRADLVTGVQTCALPIFLFLPRARQRVIALAIFAPTSRVSFFASSRTARRSASSLERCPSLRESLNEPRSFPEIGRASCRERVRVWGEGGVLDKSRGR